MSLYLLSGHQTSACGVGDGLNGFESHDDYKGSIGPDEFDVALEHREIYDTGAYERIQDGALPGDHPVVRRINGEVVRPEPFKSRNIALQSGDPLLIVK